MGYIRPPYYFTAYGLAVKHGFQGTEQEWLASLMGDNVQLRYQDGILQWKPVSAGDNAWQNLFDLSDVQGWAQLAENCRDDAQRYADDAATAAQETVAASEEFYLKAEALAKSITTRMVLHFEPGSIVTDTGEEADGIDYQKRIRSGFFPLLSQRLLISAPDGVKWRMVYYDKYLHCIQTEMSSDWFNGCGQVTPTPGTVFIRMIAGYETDSEIDSVDSLAETIAVCMPITAPDWIGDCIITILGDDTNGYSASAGLNEIQDADEAGQWCYCDWGKIRLPLVKVDAGIARFAAVVDGVEHRVEISDDGVTAVSEALGGGGAEDFHVYVEGSAGGKATVADGVNWYMIKTAHDAGRRCVCHWTVGVRTFHLPLIHDYRTNSNEHFYFSGIIDGYLVAKVHFSSAGAVDLSMTPFPQATRFLIQRSGDNYSILNSFDGEQLENAYSNTRLSAQVPSMIICSLQVTEDPISYMELPLVSRRELSGGDIYYVFSGTGDIDGETFVFTVRMTNHGGTLSFTVAQKQIPEGLYIVNVTSDASGVYSADKSYEEVLAVHNAGVRQIQCRINIDGRDFSLPLCGMTGGILAYGGSASTLSALVMQSEGGVFVTLETLATQTDIDTIDVLIGGDG